MVNSRRQISFQSGLRLDELRASPDFWGMDGKVGWQENRNAVVRWLRRRLEGELRELESSALPVAARRHKAASAAHVEESLRCIQQARTAREYEIS